MDISFAPASSSSEFSIRLFTEADLPAIMDIYAGARERMRQGGNPDQWRDYHPCLELVRGDIDKRQGYVIEKGGRICAAFAFIVGEDPTYGYVEDGRWLDDTPYGTIHRIASDGNTRGIMAMVVRFCAGIVPHNRIDTHRDNAPMRGALKKLGFTHCGTIYLLNGEKRLAYEKSFQS